MKRFTHKRMDQPIMLSFLPMYYVCYAAVLINFTYAQYYAHVKDLCLGIK